MYSSAVPFPEYEGLYFVMPANLPDRFYPNNSEYYHKTSQYVICFDKQFPMQERDSFTKSYEEYYNAMKDKGYIS